MQHEVTLPQFADGVNEAFVAQWLVSVGDVVNAGDPLVEVITDKINVVVEADAGGTLVEQCFGEEARVEIGGVLAVIEVAS